MVSITHVSHIAAAVAAFVGWAVAGLAGLRRLGVDLRDPRVQFDDTTLIVAGLVNAAVIATILVLWTVLDAGSIAALGWNWSSRHALAALSIVCATFAFALAHVYVTGRAVRFAPPDITNRMAALGVLALAVAALQEEIVFRGYVIANLAGISVVAAVLVSAVVFTAVHFVTSRGGLFPAVSWMLGGVALAAVFTLSGSIWLAAIAHLARNLANVVVLSDDQPLSSFELRTPVSAAEKTIQHATQSLGIVILAWLFFGTG